MSAIGLLILPEVLGKREIWGTGEDMDANEAPAVESAWGVPPLIFLHAPMAWTPPRRSDYPNANKQDRLMKFWVLSEVTGRAGGGNPSGQIVK